MNIDYDEDDLESDGDIDMFSPEAIAREERELSKNTRGNRYSSYDRYTTSSRYIYISEPKKSTKPDKYPVPKICPYCGNDVVLTSNAELYGREYGNGKCYLCRNCKASVGVHPDLVTPLGRLADKELKDLKMKCHELFDPYWKNKKMYRHECYKILAREMGIDAKECHFGWFDKGMLLRALSILQRGLKK